MRKMQKIRRGRFVLGLLTLIMLIGAVPAWSSTYYLYSQWGGTWHDANKNGLDDSLMCWAASASNILDWGSWDTPTYNTEAKIFQDIKDHWTNNRGWQSWAWKWWLTGAQAPYKIYAYANIPGGGANFPGTSFYSNYSTAFGSSEMATMDALMNKGYGISLVIGPNHTNQHAITCWGYDYTLTGTTKNYTALYITDSDDGVTALKKMGLAYSAANGWYFTDGYTNWDINGIYAFERKGGTVTLASGSSTGAAPGAAVTPILPTWLLVGPSALLLCLLRLRKSYAAIPAE
jgi:hypothetical protein